VFNYDKALGEQVQGIAKAVGELYIDMEVDKWTDAHTKVKSVKSLMLDLESKWDNREKEFRPLEV
jgi:hypothetical protein